MADEHISEQADYQRIISLIEQLLPTKQIPTNFMDAALKYMAFRSELLKESDRGCSLLSVSYLDCLLEDLLKAKMLGSQKHVNGLFELNGPLATLSSRILISYSLGIISKYEMEDFQIVRKIRNEFGHSFEIIDFESSKIKSYCNNFKLHVPTAGTNRDKFISVISYLAGALNTYLLGAAKYSEPKEMDLDWLKSSHAHFMKFAETNLRK
ncbi:MAG: hypothetical protein JST83_09865 [Bacteroidetes bacterium]|nr:hypothetical protein [Bacteroidota bacterium]